MTPKTPVQPMEVEELRVQITEIIYGVEARTLENVHKPDVEAILKLIQSQLTAQAAAFEKLIGEDEEEACSPNCDGDMCCDHQAWIKQGKNQMRQELRQKLHQQEGEQSV